MDSGGWYTLYADGACRGNPGPGGIGAVLMAPNGVLTAEAAEYIGPVTNNIAEWQALIMGLRLALEHGVRKLHIKMDSQLVVRQVTGEYEVKKQHLKPLYTEAMGLLRRFADYRIEHIRREDNGPADALANAAIDKAMRERS
ncbi:MAG: ribonuclease HI family protein [Deltaproteobacteria bacterium]|nr:ribonuclease HI family protein [Deltaproteobacteria bacterium]